MAELLREFTRQEFAELIKTQYPHMQYPGGVYAEVVRVELTDSSYNCVLKILDKNKRRDQRFPEVPQVRTTIPVSKGDVVIVLLLYGECRPYVLGREV